jgi:hypothetical protein
MSSARGFLSGVNNFLGSTTLHFQVSAIIEISISRPPVRAPRGIVEAQGYWVSTYDVSVPIAARVIADLHSGMQLARIGHLCGTVTILRRGAKTTFRGAGGYDPCLLEQDLYYSEH